MLNGPVDYVTIKRIMSFSLAVEIMTGSHPASCFMRLFDSSGKKTAKEIPAGFPYKLNISHIKPGVYYLQIYIGKKLWCIRW